MLRLRSLFAVAAFFALSACGSLTAPASDTGAVASDTGSAASDTGR